MSRPSVIPGEMTLCGEIEGSDDLIVFGRVEGTIRTTGVLVIEESGAVVGDVYARRVTVRGALEGDAWGRESVRVEADARLVGDLCSPRITVLPGAGFRGQVRMAEIEPLPLDFDQRAFDQRDGLLTGTELLGAPGLGAPAVDSSEAGATEVRVARKEERPNLEVEDAAASHTEVRAPGARRPVGAVLSVAGIEQVDVVPGPSVPEPPLAQDAVVLRMPRWTRRTGTMRR